MLAYPGLLIACELIAFLHVRCMSANRLASGEPSSPYRSQARDMHCKGQARARQNTLLGKNRCASTGFGRSGVGRHLPARKETASQHCHIFMTITPKDQNNFLNVFRNFILNAHRALVAAAARRRRPARPQGRTWSGAGTQTAFADLGGRVARRREGQRTQALSRRPRCPGPAAAPQTALAAAPVRGGLHDCHLMKNCFPTIAICSRTFQK